MELKIKSDHIILFDVISLLEKSVGNHELITHYRIIFITYRYNSSIKPVKLCYFFIFFKAEAQGAQERWTKPERIAQRLFEASAL